MTDTLATVRDTIARDSMLPDIHKRALLDRLVPGFTGVSKSDLDSVWSEYVALCSASRRKDD